jgi:hypothetical protein
LVGGVAEIPVMRQPTGDDEVAFPGTAGDRGPAGVALQRVRGVEPGDVFADLTGDPSCETVTQAGKLR